MIGKRHGIAADSLGDRKKHIISIGYCCCNVGKAQRLRGAAVNGGAALQGSGTDGGDAAVVVNGLVAHEGNVLAQSDGTGTSGTVLVAAVHAAEVDIGVVVVGEGAIVAIVEADDGTLVL